MSDLTATNCGCGNSNRSGGGCNSILWILILLCCCNGGDSSDGCGFGGGFFGGNNSGCGCDSIIWILLLAEILSKASVRSYLENRLLRAYFLY